MGWKPFRNELVTTVVLADTMLTQGIPLRGLLHIHHAYNQNIHSKILLLLHYQRRGLVLHISHCYILEDSTTTKFQNLSFLNPVYLHGLPTARSSTSQINLSLALPSICSHLTKNQKQTSRKRATHKPRPPPPPQGILPSNAASERRPFPKLPS